MTKDCDQREESPSREEDERQWAAFVIDYARKLTADTCWHGGTFAMRDYRQRILEGIAKWDESRANVPRTEPDPRTVIGPAGSQCGPLPTIDVLATVPNSSAAREALGLDQKTMDEAWASACRQIRSAGEDVATLIRRAAQNIEAATPDGGPARDEETLRLMGLLLNEMGLVGVALGQLALATPRELHFKIEEAVKHLTQANQAWNTAMQHIASQRNKEGAGQ